MAGKGGKREGAGRKPRTDEQELTAILKKGWPKTDRLATIQRLASDAKNGDKDAIKILMSYAYGKPVERKEIANPEGESLRVRIEYVGAGEDPNDSPA